MSESKKSNFELLRILSIVMITLHHITFTLGIEDTNLYIRLWGQFFYVGGKVGVNCFVLISGYFLSQMQFNFLRIVKTHTKVLAYCILGLFTGLCIYGWNGIGILDILQSVFPIIFDTYWFVTAYVGMLFLVPILNHMINMMNIKQFSIVITSCLILFTIIPTFTAQTIYNSNVTWFCFLYICAAYFRKFDTKIKKILSQKWVFPTAWILIWFGSVVFTIGEKWIPELREGTNFFTGMYILPQVINSISLFLLCEKTSFYNKTINYLGKHTFAGYLVQSNFILANLISDYYKAIFNLFSFRLYPIITIFLAITVISFSILIDSIFDIGIKRKVVIKIENYMGKLGNIGLNKMYQIFERKI